MDYLKYVKERKDEIIQSLVEWVNRGSVYDESTVSEGKPFGEGVYQALTYIKDKASNDGFEVDGCDGYCTEISYGEGEDYFGVFGHADVVPVGNGWECEPFSGLLKDGFIYGRGTSDDKGPTLAAYYALKFIKELQIPLKRKVKIIVGGNEESGSRCLDYYFNSLKKNHPAYGITPDAEFPLIYGEKGILGYVYSGTYSSEYVESINSGVAPNSVPDTAIIKFKKDIEKEAEFNAFLQTNNLKGSYEVVEGKTVVEVKGKAAHGAFPQGGVNALVFGLKFIKEYVNDEVFAHFATVLDGYYGENLGIAYSGDVMGNLTMNVGIGRYENNEYVFVLNIRYPIDIDHEHMIKSLDGNKFHNGKLMGDSKPLYLDPKSPFLQTLLKVYQEFSGDHETMPMTIGGGTYARSTINTVAFGMGFPKSDLGSGNIHDANERLHIDELLLGVAIYMKTIIEVANL